MDSGWTYKTGRGWTVTEQRQCKGLGNRARLRERLLTSSWERRVTTGRYLPGHRAKGSSGLDPAAYGVWPEQCVPKVNQKQGG